MEVPCLGSSSRPLIFSSSACQLLSEGVVAIFGPDSPTASAQVQWICQNHHVPYLLAQWDPIDLLADVADAYGGNKAGTLLNFTINLHPNHDEVGEALVDFLHKAEEWQQLGFIYAHDDSKIPFKSSEKCYLRCLPLKVTQNFTMISLQAF